VYDLQRDFSVQLLAIVLVGLVSLAAGFAVRDRRWWFGLDPAAGCLAFGSAVAILIGTVTPRGTGSGEGELQLVPLRTLRSYRYDHSDLLIYLLGNVVLFIPLGFFVYLTLRRRVLATTALCALVSIGVEILQLPIWTRSSDVDDVLTNTAGGFLGALAGFLVLRLYRAVRTSGHGPVRHYATGSRAS
jgi:hypothetical protein